MTYPSPSEQPEPETTPATPRGRPYAPPYDRATAAVTLVGLATGGLILFQTGEALFPVFNLLAAPVLARVLFEAASLALLVAFVVLLAVFSLSLAAYVGAAVAVPMWMHRCYRNLPVLGETDLRWSPAMAAGAWFIPFVNLVLPYLVARELCVKTSGPPVPSWLLVGLWWPAYIAVVLVNQIRHFNFRTGNGLEAVIGGVAGSGDLFDSLAALAAVATVVACGLLIVLIWHVTRRQRDRYAELLRGV